MLDSLYQSILELAEDVFYSDKEAYFFLDIDYHYLESIPKWIMDTGRSPESAMEKGAYNILLQS